MVYFVLRFKIRLHVYKMLNKIFIKKIKLNKMFVKRSLTELIKKDKKIDASFHLKILKLI